MYRESLVLFVLSGCAATLMMLAGLGKRALEPRRTRRPCPSCGRARRTCSCRTS